MNLRPALAALALAALFLPSPAGAWELQLEGRLWGWAGAGSRNDQGLRMGFRYLPALSVQKGLGRDYSLDAQVSLDIQASLSTASFDSLDHRAEVDPYRLWARLSSSQTEIRLGLQKINFGPARLLRSLRWFDQLDPRDPLGLTEGVWGLLGRYYFLNNANIWLWGLYGNEETKGWETFPTLDESAEWGGRVQLPLLGGEVGAVFHHRRADLKEISAPSASELRLGLDGRWDAGVGLWFEAALTCRDTDQALFRYEKFLTLGLDYTFSLGNGLGLILEHLVRDLSADFWELDQGRSLSALSLSYSLGLHDSLGLIAHFDWTGEEAYLQVSWKRVYDRWTFYLIGFANPDRDVPGLEGKGGFSAPGKGAMFVFSFSH